MGEPIVDPVTGDVIDPETGEVVGRVMVHGCEASARLADPGRRFFYRVTPTIHDHGLHSYVEDERLGRLNEALRRPRCRLARELSMLRDACYKLFEGAGSAVVEVAAPLLRRLERLVPYNVRPGCVVGAAVVIAARELGIPVDMGRVAEVLGVPRVCVWRCVKRAWRAGISVRPVAPQRFLPRLAEALGASDLVPLASELLHRASSFATPKSLAAAALYIALAISDRRASARRVASVAGLCERSVTKAVLRMLERVDIEVALDEDRGGGGEE